MFKIGDYVRMSGDYLRNTGQVAMWPNIPLEGKVIDTRLIGRSVGIPTIVEIEAVDGTRFKALATNLELDPTKQG